MKKKTIAALSLMMSLCLSACSVPGTSNTSSAEEAEEEEVEVSINEGVLVTYRIVDKDPSKEDIEDTIDTVSERIKVYADRMECDVDDDLITFQISMDTEENNASRIVRAVIRHGGLCVLDAENYEAFSNDEDYESAITGEDVEKASGSQMTDAMGNISYVVQIELTDEGAVKFADFTKNNLNATSYIIFDGKVVSEPRILNPIENGNVYITGLNSLEEAEALAADIIAGTLPLELELVEYEIIEDD